jgi:hypothetical protein
MIDLSQVSQALRGATQRSLLILDEFGKGSFKSQDLYSPQVPPPPTERPSSRESSRGCSRGPTLELYFSPTISEVYQW